MKQHPKKCSSCDQDLMPNEARTVQSSHSIYTEESQIPFAWFSSTRVLCASCYEIWKEKLQAGGGHAI